MGQDPELDPFQPRGHDDQDEQKDDQDGRRTTPMKMSTWNCAKQPTQRVLDIAPKADVVALQELNPPRSGEIHASWRGWHLICAARQPGRRHGVCGLALSGEAWSRVASTEGGRWSFTTRLSSWRCVFVSIHLPVRGAPVETLEAALNDVTRQLQRVTHRDDMVIVMGDLNCKSNRASTDDRVVGSFVSEARTPDARAQRIVAWMSELGLKCSSTFFASAASRLGRLGQRDTAINLHSHGRRGTAELQSGRGPGPTQLFGPQTGGSHAEVR